MEYQFVSFFQDICKIKKKWGSVFVYMKKNSTSSKYQVEAIGPFAYFTLNESENYSFILFMPDFSPFNQNEGTIILQPSDLQNNFRYSLIFSSVNDSNSFLKYWYDSLILVEDMLRAIILKKHSQSEKILFYNKNARVFQEVTCVIQAISSVMVFQTQIFNESGIIPGVSLQIDKSFSSGIVSPLNTIVPYDKRLFSFFISKNQNKGKYYFVCSNKESLMKWILILHGLACQTKYTDNAIDEQTRSSSLIEKINKMINDNEMNGSQKSKSIEKSANLNKDQNSQEADVGIQSNNNKAKGNEQQQNETKQASNSFLSFRFLIIVFAIIGFFYLQSFF